MTTTEPAVDRQYAQQMLIEITAQLVNVAEERFGSTSMVDYHYDTLVTLETRQRLWSAVVDVGWDQAVSALGNYVRSVTAGLSTSTPRQIVELRAALRWWADNRRRAMREGLDMEYLVMAL